jgi:hypothetical protein
MPHEAKPVVHPWRFYYHVADRQDGDVTPPQVGNTHLAGGHYLP